MMTIGTALKMTVGSAALCVFAISAQADYIANSAAGGNIDLEANVVVAADSLGEPDEPVFADDFEIASITESSSFDVSVEPITAGASVAVSPVSNNFPQLPEPSTWTLLAAGVSAIGIGWRKRRA